MKLQNWESRNDTTVTNGNDEKWKTQLACGLYLCCRYWLPHLQFLQPCLLRIGPTGVVPNKTGYREKPIWLTSGAFRRQKMLPGFKKSVAGSTPVVLNGRVYIDCRTDDDVNDPDEKVHAREQVVCFDAASGEVVWRDKFNVFQTDIPAPRVGWAAMCGDLETGNVYLHSVSGLFRCYDPDGNVVWERSLAEEFGKISGYGGRTQTPIIDEDRVILSFMATNWGDEKGPGPKHYYYAFDKKTGELQWVSAPGGAPKDTNYSVPWSVSSMVSGS